MQRSLEFPVANFFRKFSVGNNNSKEILLLKISLRILMSQVLCTTFLLKILEFPMEFCSLEISNLFQVYFMDFSVGNFPRGIFLLDIYFMVDFLCNTVF